jgi:hypothetical protein
MEQESFSWEQVIFLNASMSFKFLMIVTVKVISWFGMMPLMLMKVNTHINLLLLLQTMIFTLWLKLTFRG